MIFNFNTTNLPEAFPGIAQAQNHLILTLKKIK